MTLIISDRCLSLKLLIFKLICQCVTPRELKAMLLKADCICEQGKGSHTKCSHPLLDYKITISGKDGNDAKRYQEKDVKDLLKDIQEAQK